MYLTESQKFGLLVGVSAFVGGMLVIAYDHFFVKVTTEDMAASSKAQHEHILKQARRKGKKGKISLVALSVPKKRKKRRSA